MPSFNTFNLADVYQAGEAIRGARNRNTLAEMEIKNAPEEMKRRNALLDQQIAAGERAATEFTQEQKITNTKLLNAAAAEVAKNPAAASRWIPQLQQAGILDPNVDLSRVPPEQLQQSAKALFDSTSEALRALDGTQKAPQLSETEGPFGSRVLTFGNSMRVIEAQDKEQPKDTPKPPAGYQFAPDGALAPIPGGPADPKNKPTDFSRADKLRDEYNAASKDFITIADNYSAMRQVAADVSAAGDLSLIFSYMKMLDPGSVVREQEFANAQNAGGVPDRVRAAYNRILRGERLSEAQRADFMNQAGNVLKAKQQRHDATVKKRYTDMAKRWNLNPQDVVSDLNIEPAPASSASQAEITATGPNGQKIVLRNGQWVPR